MLGIPVTPTQHGLIGKAAELDGYGSTAAWCREILRKAAALRFRHEIRDAFASEGPVSTEEIQELMEDVASVTRRSTGREPRETSAGGPPGPGKDSSA